MGQSNKTCKSVIYKPQLWFSDYKTTAFFNLQTDSFLFFSGITVDITATANSDYQPLNALITLQTDFSLKRFTVTLGITDDDVFEGNETMMFIFSLLDGQPPCGNPIADPANTTVVIVDDERKYSNEEVYYDILIIIPKT